MLTLQESAAKRLKTPEDSYSKLKEYHSESDKEDETGKKIDQEKYRSHLQIEEYSKELGQLYPVLESYLNTCATDADCSCKIRFDDIGQGTPLYLFVPPGLREDIMGYRTFSSGSEKCGIATFRTPQLARRFLHLFNGLKIPGTSLTYKLSWAPFGLDHYFDNDCMTEDVPKDVCEALVAGDDTVTEIKKSFDCFYLSRHETAHREKRAFWSWPAPEAVYYPDKDDGLTTLMLLFNVDPVLKENQIKDLIGCWVECTVELFDDCGFGIVKFEDRRFANKAYEKAISDENKGFFQCTWGFKKKRPVHRYIFHPVGRCEFDGVERYLYRKIEYHHCHLFGEDCDCELLSVPTVCTLTLTLDDIF